MTALVEMSDGELRAVLRAALEERERAAAERSGRAAARGGRLRVRWGEYQPRM